MWLRRSRWLDRFRLPNVCVRDMALSLNTIFPFGLPYGITVTHAAHQCMHSFRYWHGSALRPRPVLVSAQCGTAINLDEESVNTIFLGSPDHGVRTNKKLDNVGCWFVVTWNN